MQPLVSLQNLAWQLQVPLTELRGLATNINQHYKKWEKKNKKTGKVRNFKTPDAQLKKVQREILRRVLVKHPLSDAVHGGVKGKSPKSNAECHLGKSAVVNIDVSNFFPNVSHRRVAKMFIHEFGCGRDTAWLLTRLTTVDGQLPQGAPTSTMIANILLANPVDLPIGEKASVRCVQHTRFVDDITFSGENAHSLINETAHAVSRVGLKINRTKLKITSHSSRQEVTGFTVNSSNGPSVARYKRDRIRAAIHQLKFKPHTDQKRALSSICGRLNHLRQFNPGSAARMQRQLDKVLTQVAVRAT